MSSRRLLVFSILLLGLLAPLTPRAMMALLDEKSAEQLSLWLVRSGRLEALLDWIPVLLPSALLALFAAVVLRPSVDRPLREARARRVWATLAATYLLGLYCCKPAVGQGMNFYLGEMVYPFLAAPVMAFTYGIAALIWQPKDPFAGLPDEWSPPPEPSRSSKRPVPTPHSRDR
jgi:hypothetical protein